MIISLYILVELKSSVRKLLPQLARDQCQTWKYYEAPHGDGHKGVDRRRFAAPAKSAARFSSVTENGAMFFIHLRSVYTGFQLLNVSKRCHAKGGAFALCHATVLQLTLSMAPY